MFHGLLVIGLVWQGKALVERRAGRAGPRGGGGSERTVQFFTLPASPAVVAVDLPPIPKVVLSEIPPIEPPPLTLTRIDVPVPSLSGALQASSVRGPGTGGGSGGGAGPVAGTASGPGTGGEDGYIVPPNPRGVIVPPDKAPRSVKGRKYRATFWVGADGRVQRVDVSPDIRDADYRRALYERLMDFAFYPARNRVGLPVPGVVPIDFAIP